MYKPMRLHLETARLRLQPWDESDAGDLCALHSERVNLTRTPNVERTREFIAEGRVRAAATGLAVLPIRRRHEGDSSFRAARRKLEVIERDHASADDGGELVWLTRSLP